MIFFKRVYSSLFIFWSVWAVYGTSNGKDQHHRQRNKPWEGLRRYQGRGQGRRCKLHGTSWSFWVLTRVCMICDSLDIWLIIEKISLYMFRVKIFQRILLLFDYYWKSMPVLHMSNDCLSACKSFAVKELFILHNSCIFLIGCRMLSWKKTRYMHAWALNLLYSGWQCQWSSIPLILN